MSATHSAKFWSLTSHVGTHRRSESAPEIRGLGLDPPFTSPLDDMSSDSRPSSRGMKRKMSVIDEDDQQSSSPSKEMGIDSELTRIMLQEGAEMGEMGDLVIVDNTTSIFSGDSTLSSKRRSWRRSLQEWWKKV